MYPSPMQLCGQATALAQAAWGHECQGNPAAAGQLYHQAVQLYAAARAQTGGRLPDPAHFCLGCAQVRLGWLSHVGGNPAWAEQWLRLALPELEAAWRACPANPHYQHMLGHTATLLGRTDLADAVSRTAAPQPAPTGRPPSGGGDWVKWLKQGKELLDLFGSLTGGTESGPPGGMGMDWQGGDFGGPGW